MRAKIITGLLILSGLFANAQNTLLIPDTLSGTNINLTLQQGTMNFYSGVTTNTMGANGNILGPTLFLEKGTNVSISVDNQLPTETTIHWHGLHVAPENDGGPHSIIQPNTTWNPQFEVMDKAGVYWYHPHLHMQTELHVSKGIAGLIIVRDQEEAALALPRRYGVDDFPIVMQTKAFDASGQIIIGSALDTSVMVNGTVNAVLDAPAQVIRMRMLNGTTQRVLNLGLTNNKQFKQIGSDGGLLEAPVTLTRLMLSPGERAEILIDLGSMQGQTIALTSFGSELPNAMYGAAQPGMGPGLTIPNYTSNPLNGGDFDFLQLNVVAPTANPITTIPFSLVQLFPYDEADADTTRTLTFTPQTMGPNALNGAFLINSTPFNMSVMNQVIRLGNTEIWELVNQSPIAHPFHIHDVQFFILDRNGNQPPTNERGRKDVVLVKSQETVRFIAKFDDFTNDSIPFMYHCHMLTHEDGGMMHQFLVLDSNSINSINKIQDSEISIYPNPVLDELSISMLTSELKIKAVEIIDLTGKVVLKNLVSDKRNFKVDVSELEKGIYFVKVYTDKGILIEKVVKK